MKHLIIIGARGFGREVYGLALESCGYGSEYDIKGFLDDKSDALDGFNNYPPIIGPVESYDVQANDTFICALGDVHYRQKYANIILKKGGRFLNLIHNTAILGKNITIGVGCVICNYANISCDVTIGDFCNILPFSGLGHDSIMGNYIEMESGVSCGGGVSIKDFATIHPGAIILPHKTIGEASTIGAGAVVIRNVKPGITVIGNPAKEIKF